MYKIVPSAGAEAKGDGHAGTVTVQALKAMVR